MAKINSNYNKLAAGYLFPEISKRVKIFLDKNPGVSVIRLGIGNTTEPLVPGVVSALHSAVDKLADSKTYSGYGDDLATYAIPNFREAIVDYYKRMNVSIENEEVFVSDGAKSDLGNLLSIFSNDSIVAVQDPTYPAYVDASVISGLTGTSNGQQYAKVIYMPCNEKNNFFPEPPKAKADLIFLCSPNNPTGAVASRAQLKAFVEYARKNKAVIIFDAAYNWYVSDSALPKSIYEIEGASECAIEVNSFSKYAGFTGVRLGWSIIPKKLMVDGSEAGKVNSIWNRRQCTLFNGASNIVQAGGLFALSPQGVKENLGLVNYYLENAKIIRRGLEEKGLKVVSGGTNAPYIWVRTPKGMKSWDFFDKILSEANVVVTPGSGFGPSGEGYFRVSAFGHRENVIKAVESIRNKLKL
ncbi:LL-diaminopimelate aminotransferase [uncultured archaeon]|nr:LL-diaminopimelate aminotransferase [uncultured archaeon]